MLAKQNDAASNDRSALRSGTRIETAVAPSMLNLDSDRSALRSGTRIETCGSSVLAITCGIVPLFGAGRGLKPQNREQDPSHLHIVPLFGAGRGLKLGYADPLAGLPQYRSALRSGTRIETRSSRRSSWAMGHRSALRSGTRIETPAAAARSSSPSIVPLFGAGRGLKPQGAQTHPLRQVSFRSSERDAD